MSTNHRQQPAIFRTLLIVLLLCFGTELKAQSPEARPNAEPTSSDQTSEIRKFTFKHAKADEAWKMRTLGDTTYFWGGGCEQDWKFLC